MGRVFLWWQRHPFPCPAAALPTLVFRKEYRNNPKLFGLRTVVIGERGIVSDSPLGHIEATWDNSRSLGSGESLCALSKQRRNQDLPNGFRSQNELDRCRTLLAAKIPTPRGRCFAARHQGRFHPSSTSTTKADCLCGCCTGGLTGSFNALGWLLWRYRASGKG